METVGSYLLSWDSSTRWREEFSLPHFGQIRVGGQGGVWELREPSYLSLPLWQLMKALTSYGRLELQEEESAGKVKLSEKSGSKLRCIEVRWHRNPIRRLCFRMDSPELASEDYLLANRTYEFSDYVAVGTKSFPGHILVYDGRTLAADLSIMKLEMTNNPNPDTYQKPAKAEWRAWCVSPESGGDPLTPIYSRHVKNKGNTVVFGAVGIDGLWQGIQILESGGPEHDSEVLQALKRERWKRNSCNGVPIEVETVFRR